MKYLFEIDSNSMLLRVNRSQQLSKMLNKVLSELSYIYIFSHIYIYIYIHICRYFLLGVSMLLKAKEK